MYQYPIHIYPLIIYLIENVVANTDTLGLSETINPTKNIE